MIRTMVGAWASVMLALSASLGAAASELSVPMQVETVQSGASGTSLHQAKLTRFHVLNIQRKLNGLGYDAGTPDGVAGGRTRAAIEDFQRDRGLPITGEVSHGLLAALRGEPHPAQSATITQQPVGSDTPSATAQENHDFDISLIQNTKVHDTVTEFNNSCEADGRRSDIYHCTCLSEILTNALVSGDLSLKDPNLEFHVFQRLTPENDCMDDEGAFAHVFRQCMRNEEDTVEAREDCRCSAKNFVRLYKASHNYSRSIVNSGVYCIDTR